MPKIVLLSTSIYILICLYNSSVVSAYARVENKNDLSFDIKPVINEIQLKPGAQKKIGFEITNYSEKALPVSIKLTSFALNSANQTVLAEPPPQVVNIIKFAEQLSPWSLVLDPLEIKEFSPTVILPKNYKEGDYYLSFVFESSLKDTSVSEFRFQNNLQIASLLFLTVGENPKPNLSLSNFSSGNVFWRNPVDFDLIIKNTGRVRFKGNCTLRINSFLGKTVTLLQTAPFTILADSEKTITNNNQSLTWIAPNFPNLYKASVVVTDLKTNHQQLYSSLWFVYVPLWFTICALIFLALCLNWYKKRSLHKE